MEALGCWLGSVAERLFPRTVHDQIFAQILLDLREEQAEALAQRRVWKARGVHLLYIARFSFCLIALLGKEDVMIRSLSRLVGKQVTSRNLDASLGARFLYAGSLAVLVLGGLTVSRLELTEPQVVFGVLLVLAVALLMVIAGLVVERSIRHPPEGAPPEKDGKVRWSLLTMAGLAAGILAALVFGEPIEAVVGMILVTPVLTLLVGAVLGTGQWLDLRHRVSGARFWILATCLGVGAGLAGGVVIVELTGRWLTGEQVRIVQLGVAARALSFAVVGLVMGLAMGAAQWLGVLRRHGIPARGWIAVSALSLGLSFSLSSLIVDTLLGGIASPVGVISLVLLTGLFFGAGTARAIARAV